jgi:hypothetical protein
VTPDVNEVENERNGMAADDFTQHNGRAGDVEAGMEPALGSAPPRRPPSTAVRPTTSRPMTSRSVVMSRLQVKPDRVLSIFIIFLID